MNNKSWATLRLIACGYVLYLSVTNLYKVATQNTSNKAWLIIAFGVLGIASIIFLVPSFRLLKNSKIKTPEEQNEQQISTLEEGAPNPEETFEKPEDTEDHTDDSSQD
jgi:cytoskeletal protein RodZ